MGYETAPATKLLATHCAVCVRPLVDAVSVETGMGPDCRKKYFKPEEGTPENRKLVNQLVYQVAAKQTGPEVLEAVQAIANLGFKTLADILIKRLAKIVITVEGNNLLVKAPYSETAVPMMAKVPGRRWIKERKLNQYPLASKGPLWETLKAAFPGVVAHGPNGFFIVGAKPATKAKPVATPAVAPTSSSVKVPRDTGRVAPVADLVKQLKLDEAERQAEIDAEAKADREQTLREESAKFEARKAMEHLEEEAEEAEAQAEAKASTTKGSVEQLRAKYRAEQSLQ